VDISTESVVDRLCWMQPSQAQEVTEVDMAKLEIDHLR
jgi:hypothetical protein